MQFKHCIAIGLFASALTFPSIAHAAVVRYDPVATGGVRQIGAGDPGLLTFFAIKNILTLANEPFVDQGIIEFDVSNVQLAANEQAKLSVELLNIDSSPPRGVIDLASYVGNGGVDIGDLNAGTVFNSFTSSSDFQDEYLINVTSVVEDAIATEQPYVGFNFSTQDRDRFNSFFNNDPTISPPQLVIVPEPMTVAGTVLAAVGGVGLLRRRSGWKSKSHL